MFDREAVLARAEKESPRELGLMLCQLADAAEQMVIAYSLPEECLLEVLANSDTTQAEDVRLVAMVEKLTGVPQ